MSARMAITIHIFMSGDTKNEYFFDALREEIEEKGLDDFNYGGLFVSYLDQFEASYWDGPDGEWEDETYFSNVGMQTSYGWMFIIRGNLWAPIGQLMTMAKQLRFRMIIEVDDKDEGLGNYVEYKINEKGKLTSTTRKNISWKSMRKNVAG